MLARPLFLAVALLATSALVPAFADALPPKSAQMSIAPGATGTAAPVQLYDGNGGQVPIGTLNPAQHSFTLPLGSVPWPYFDVRNFLLPSDGGDYTGAFQRAIAAAGAAGGGNVMVPGPVSVAGKVVQPFSNVAIAGYAWGNASITCTGSGTGSCLLLGGTATAPVGNIALRDLTLNVPSRTGGECVDMVGVSGVIVQNVAHPNCWGGYTITASNNVTLDNVPMQNIRGGAGTRAIYWFTDPSTGLRSDVLNLNKVVVNAHFGGAEGIEWDGASYTLRIHQSNMLAVNHGLWVRNTAHSQSAFPQELEADAFEVDGAMATACQVDAGFNMTFASSVCSNSVGDVGQGGNDGPALVVNSDTGASYTRMVRFIGSRAENASKQAAYVNAHDFFSSGSSFSDASKAGKGLYPAVEFGGSCANCQAVGGRMGPAFGNALNSSYGAQVDAGSSGVVLAAIDYSNNVTGEVNDQTGAASVLYGIDHNGYPLGAMVGGSTGTPGNFYQRSVPGGVVENRLLNAGTGSNTVSRDVLQTGSAGAYAAMTQGDGALPFFALNTGSGDTGGITIDASAAPGAPLQIKAGGLLSLIGGTGGIVVDASGASGTPIILKPGAGGLVQFASGDSFALNGTTTVQLGNVGPAGAHQYPVKWLKLTDNGGSIIYIPAF